MFGLLKQTIPSSEFGLCVLTYADKFISNDACRSLAFPSYNASRGWTPVFKANGVPVALAQLYLRFYTHCILQGVFKQYPLSQRSMVHGAVSGLRDSPTGYEFGKVFDELETVFNRRYKFDPRVAALNDADSGQQDYLAEPAARFSISKYLIDRFILSRMQNSKGYFDKFDLYSGDIGVSLTTAHRAIKALSSKVKIGPQADTKETHKRQAFGREAAGATKSHLCPRRRLLGEFQPCAEY